MSELRNHLPSVFLYAAVASDFFWDKTLLSFGLLLLALGACFLREKRRFRFERRMLFILPFLGVCWGYSLGVANVSPYYSLSRFGYLFLLIILLENDSVEERTVHLLYFALLFFAWFHLFVSWREGLHTLVLPGLDDKNYTAVFFFTLFLLSWKRVRIGGIVTFAVYLTLFERSRSTLLLLGLFFLCQGAVFVMRKTERSFPFFRHPWLLFGFLLLAVCIFSYIWVYYISVGELSEYRASLNDGSNRMRFVSNIKALTMLQEPHLLWSGYGPGLTKILGVDWADLSLHTHYLGVRLVQPHNVFLNLLVKIGILPGLLYFGFIARLLKRKNTVDNLPYIFPFLVNALLMHSLMEANWLVFWMVIVYLERRVFFPERHGWEILFRHISGGREDEEKRKD